MKILEGPLLSVNCISDCTYKHSSECVSHSVMSDSLLGSSVHGILQTRIPIQKSCHSLLPGIFPTPGLNPSILHRGQILYPLSQKAQYKSIALYSFLRGSALKSPVETAWEIPRDKEELRSTPPWRPSNYKIHTNMEKLLLLSRFSRVRLCATPQTAAHQAPPSLGFSR